MDNILQAATAFLAKIQGVVAAHPILDKGLTDMTSAAKNGVQASTAFLGDIGGTANFATFHNVNGQNPRLRVIPSLILHLLSWLIPELWLLRISLCFFGFGLAGPGRGSVAAWLQGYFRGGTGAAGGWFSLLQAAMMGVIQIWVGFVLKAPLIGGLLAIVLPYFVRG